MGMEFGKGVGVGVDVGESEFHFAQGLHDLKHVEGPAALFYLQFFWWAKPVVGGSHLLSSLRLL
jgi:hypothetical protein